MQIGEVDAHPAPVFSFGDQIADVADGIDAKEERLGGHAHEGIAGRRHGACLPGRGCQHVAWNDDKAADVPAKLREAVLGDAGAPGIFDGWGQNRKAHSEGPRHHRGLGGEARGADFALALQTADDEDQIFARKDVQVFADAFLGIFATGIEAGISRIADRRLLAGASTGMEALLGA